MSSKLWLYNYDFEFELAGDSPIYLRGKHLIPWYYLNRSSHLLFPFISPKDRILTHSPGFEKVIEDLKRKNGIEFPFLHFHKDTSETNSALRDFSAGNELINKKEIIDISPWGWSPEALDVSRQRFDSKFSLSFDPLKLNSKELSFELRERFLPASYGYPSKLIKDKSLDETQLQEIIGSFQAKHSSIYLKHFFGTSGKLSDLLSTKTISLKTLKKWRTWIRKTGGILLEKKIDDATECSIQVMIHENGAIEPIAYSEMLTTTNGSYLGNIFDPADGGKYELLIRDLSPVFKKLSLFGYSGPIGFDLLRCSDGSVKLVEINCRLTMGRVAYEWNRFLNRKKIGLFSNLFLNSREYADYDTLVSKCCRLEIENDCVITVLNTVHSNQNPLSLITILIGANKKNDLFKTLENIKPSLFQNVV